MAIGLLVAVGCIGSMLWLGVVIGDVGRKKFGGKKAPIEVTTETQSVITFN